MSLQLHTIRNSHRVLCDGGGLGHSDISVALDAGASVWCVAWWLSCRCAGGGRHSSCAYDDVNW